MQDIRSRLQERMLDAYGRALQVEIGMRYGGPSIGEGLRALRSAGARRIVLLPLFPQYSRVTTASAYDAVEDELAGWSDPPELSSLDQYYDNPGYIQALAASVLEFWKEHGEPERLLLSYHGIPQSYARKGDPYGRQCHETTRLVMEALDTNRVQIQTSFQSRFGPQEWLKPYTDELLRSLAEAGAGSVDVLCPGFAADCLETLHEIGVEAREDFERWGGGALRYIPALNARPAHIEALRQILAPQLEEEKT